MVFTSVPFLFVFLPVVLIGFFLLVRYSSPYAARLWLLIASLVFYGWWNPAFIFLIASSIVVNFGLGRVLLAEGRNRRVRHLALVAGIVFNLGLLGYFKYYNFFLSVVGDVTGYSFATAYIVLPLAISFFTFQQIAYLADAYEGQESRSRFTDYALFVSFFPQLIAGPIVRHREIMPQLMRPETFRFDATNLRVGATIFVIGVFKKAVLADSLATYVDPLYLQAEAGPDLDLVAAWAASIGFALQVYFDFSAYSDMATGLARMVNVVLPTNFFSPYKATNYVELWRRWHVTLTGFFRDYLFVPLTRGRHSRMTQYAVVFLVMVLAGLWHGAGWTFLLFGVVNGAFLVVNYVWRRAQRRLHLPFPGKGSWGRGVAWALTFGGWLIGVPFFRCATVDGAERVLEGMAGLNGIALPRSLHAMVGGVSWIQESGMGGIQMATMLAWLAGGMAIVLLLPNTLQWLERFQPTLDYRRFANVPSAITAAWRPSLVTAMALGVLLFIAVQAMVGGRSPEFIYFRF
ncbi:MAG: membrane-bound O-acyltransferase family protein [Rhodospirillaceae bacterium]|nr:membrane-bound O-acyltransferase family protein [Rhodospirillaceae bacterium]